MEIVCRSSPVNTVSLSSLLPNLGSNGRFPLNQKNLLFRGINGYSSLSPFLSLRIRKSVIPAAKKDKKKGDKKPDNHSFVARPDEATGPYPEAVLLKEKKVQEDGRLLPDFANDEERKLYEQLNLELESALNLEQMRHYEVVYLIHENHVKEVEDVNLKVQDFIKEKKGRMWRFSDWGVRQLAYKIQKARKAHYILTNFELEAKSINELKMMLDQDERVIRHLVIKKDEAETEDCPPPPEFHTLYGDMDEDDDSDDEADDEGDEEDIDDADDDEDENDADNDEDDEGEELDDEGDDEDDEGDDEDDEDYVESNKSRKVIRKGRKILLRPRKGGR